LAIEYSTRMTTLSGEETDLSSYRGKVMLVVNTASKCGLTPQYAELQALHDELGPKGLVILGFPCNQFLGQEPGTSEDIAAFCEVNYGVTFPMHSRVEVNGPHTHALFQQLKRAAPGLLGSQVIKWNFTKFIVNRKGEVVARHAPKTSPALLRGELLALL
jgi:glutathione peroxidase